MKKTKLRLEFDDGFMPELIPGAEFDGKFETPVIKPLEKTIIPTKIVPFSHRNMVDNPEEYYICFYEHDKNFADVIRNPWGYVEDFKRFGGIFSPDCTLLRDSPFLVQAANVYKNRIIGSFFQREGIPVITNVRWGDERSYDTGKFSEPVAFLGAPKKNVLAIGTYGCVRGEENAFYFREGLRKMLKYLQPDTVLVYGPTPASIFASVTHLAKFIQYNNWDAVRHGKDPYGHLQ